MPGTFGVFVYNGLRIPAGTILLLLAMKLSGRSIAVRRKHILHLGVLAFFGMFLFMVLFILGISLTSSANTGIILATTPLLILVVSFISKIERPTLRTVSGILIGFCGMIVMAYRKGGLSCNNRLDLSFYLSLPTSSFSLPVAETVLFFGIAGQLVLSCRIDNRVDINCQYALLLLGKQNRPLESMCLYKSDTCIYTAPCCGYQGRIHIRPADFRPCYNPHRYCRGKIPVEKNK